MTEKILKISADFWNIRGEFKLFGLLNIGTHTSLVRLKSGKFVLLDAYSLTGDVKKEVDAYTHDGKDIEAIINLHPFHTVHVEQAHKDYPNAKLYGTKRHVEKLPNLPWQAELTESDEFAARFAEDFLFSVPEGVDFISSNEHLHFSSVLAYHKASKAMHVDDTLMYLKLPGLLGMVKSPEVSFHMTLSKTLEKRPGAVEDFRSWARHLAVLWSDTKVLCAAHSATLIVEEGESPSISSQILKALRNVDDTLEKHQKKFG